MTSSNTEEMRKFMDIVQNYYDGKGITDQEVEQLKLVLKEGEVTSEQRNEINNCLAKLNGKK